MDLYRMWMKMGRKNCRRIWNRRIWKDERARMIIVRGGRRMKQGEKNTQVMKEGQLRKRKDGMNPGRMNTRKDEEGECPRRG